MILFKVGGRLLGTEEYIFYKYYLMAEYYGFLMNVTFINNTISEWLIITLMWKRNRESFALKLYSSLNSLFHNQPLLNLIEYKNYCYAVLFFLHFFPYQVVYSTDTHIQGTVGEGRSHSLFRYHFHSIANIQTSNWISVFEIHI